MRTGVTLPRELRKAGKQAEREGWRIVPCTNGHARWLHPDGVQAVTTGGTSCSRGLANDKAQLRKAGLSV